MCPKSHDTPSSSESLAQRFHRLAEKWERATGCLSSMSKAAEHPVYQEIISMDPAVLVNSGFPITSPKSKQYNCVA
jgi:hypothetical protein